MNGSLLCWLALVAAVSVNAERKHWAVLIAGSSTYMNYRHQADVCHAYQILSKHGIPDKQIIVMMYDDIAFNKDNPVKGNIINRPGGPNVYPGVPKDYTGKDVNANTFLKVLQGDKEGIEKLIGRPGKVLESGPEDYVFVNFADHGGPGNLGMPHPPYLKARALNNALKQMHKEKRFAKLTFYVEACESGSMFNKLLPKDINVYATTTASPHEPSEGCYCSNDRETCLGDTYSVNWMENSDAMNLHNETLLKQFDVVKQETNTSHVHRYGDFSFTSDHVDAFLGNGSSPSVPTITRINLQDKTTVPSELVGIHTLQSMLNSNNLFYANRKHDIKKTLRAQLWIRSQTSQIVRSVASRVLAGKDIAWALEQRSSINNWDCYENTMDRLIELCPRMEPSRNDFVLRRMNVLVNLCNSQPEWRVMEAVEEAALDAPICY